MDNTDHYHNSDRFPSRDTLIWLQSLEKVTTVTGTYAVSSEDDIIVVNGTSLAITLPIARNGKHYTFTMTNSSTATITPTSPDTISGGASLALSSSNSPYKIKAVSTGWVRI